MAIETLPRPGPRAVELAVHVDGQGSRFAVGLGDQVMPAAVGQASLGTQFGADAALADDAERGPALLELEAVTGLLLLADEQPVAGGLEVDFDQEIAGVNRRGLEFVTREGEFLGLADPGRGWPAWPDSR